MIKSELVDHISVQYLHLYRRDVERIIDAILNTTVTAMARTDRVELRGFGAFSVRVREARTGRNPRTGVPIRIMKKLSRTSGLEKNCERGSTRTNGRA
jgi:integration host factor subunit beta